VLPPLNSWEFLFALNILFAALAPLILAALGKLGISVFKSFFILSFGLIGVASLKYLVDRQGDFQFQLKLIGLHSIVSLFSILFIYRITRPPRKILKTYAVLFVSLTFSTISFFLTPSLYALDPFWGVLPGTISLDPVISLYLYETRLWILLLSLLVVLGMGFKFSLNAVHFILIFILIHLGFGVLKPNPLSFQPFFGSHFKIALKDQNFSVFFESEDSSPWQIPKWKRELEYHFFEITKLIPNSLRIPKDLNLRVYIYDSDGSKKKWIGAENPQIGNFIRGEMHISGLDINSSTLRHELVHLIHGKLKSPMISYADPFLFEGLAVALTANDLDQLIADGRSLVQAIQEKSAGLNWPRSLNFFDQYSGAVSYKLAGAAAALTLKTGKFPWETTPEMSAFLEPKASQTELKIAREMLTVRSLMKDPLARDCHRLFQELQDSPTYAAWEYFLTICSASPLAYESIYLLPSKRELALHRLIQISYDHSDSSLAEAHGDLAVLADDSDHAVRNYSKARGRRAAWKKTLVEKRKSDLLRKILESESRITKRLAIELSASERDSSLYLSSFDLIDRKEVLSQIQQIRALKTSENWLLAESEFYESRSGKDSLRKARDLLRQFPLVLKQEQQFRSRLEWEIKNPPKQDLTF